MLKAQSKPIPEELQEEQDATKTDSKAQASCCFFSLFSSLQFAASNKDILTMTFAASNKDIVPP